MCVGITSRLRGLCLIRKWSEISLYQSGHRICQRWANRPLILNWPAQASAQVLLSLPGQADRLVQSTQSVSRGRARRDGCRVWCRDPGPRLSIGRKGLLLFPLLQPGRTVMMQSFAAFWYSRRSPEGSADVAFMLVSQLLGRFHCGAGLFVRACVTHRRGTPAGPAHSSRPGSCFAVLDQPFSFSPSRCRGYSPRSKPNSLPCGRPRRRISASEPSWCAAYSL